MKPWTGCGGSALILTIAYGCGEGYGIGSGDGYGDRYGDGPAHITAAVMVQL